MIRVLVVEDSTVERELLIRIISSDPEITIVGVATDGEAAVRAAARLKPDVITMDICMPKFDGIEATRRIMQLCPTRIIVVTNSFNASDAYKSFQAIEAGALITVLKPAALTHPDHKKQADILINDIKLMSEIKVIRRFSKTQALGTDSPDMQQANPAYGNIRLVAIGASTGGPAVIAKILTGLPKDYPFPIVIVQHMTSGFIESFASWLALVSQFTVRVAAHGEELKPGIAYVGPDDYHIVVDGHNRVALTKEKPINSLRPSVGLLFKSVADNLGNQAAGVLLTGMGSDGAHELKRMKDRGALTIIQNSESCVVFGMPGEAYRIGAAKYVLDPDSIIELLRGLKDRR